MTNDNIQFLMAVTAAVLIAFIIALLPKASDQPGEQTALYCEMVALSIETDGELGWPDFRNRYTKDC